MAALRKIIVLLAIAVMALGCYAEEQKTGIAGTDSAAIAAKITELEAKMEKLSQEVKEMQEEIKKLNAANAELTRTLRNLALASQSVISVRPAMETWKSVKKGMVSDAVLDLLGNPEEVKVLNSGDVWYYYGLGNISFDRNGKVNYIETSKKLPLEGKVR